MAQFDVYINPSQSSRERFPYLVDIQSPFIADIATRIVLPLGNASLFNNQAMARLTPEITYQGEKLLLLTPQISSVPARLLTERIGSLSHFREHIIRSLDFAIAGV